MSTDESQPNAYPPIKYVSSDDDKSIAKFADIITNAFWDAPLMPAFIVEQDDLQPPYPQSISYDRRLEHFEAGITSLIKNGAITVYAGDFSALAIWFAPDYAGPGFGESRKRSSPLTLELGAKLTAIEQRLFATDTDTGTMRPTWHLSFLVRNPDAGVERVKGGISAVVKPFVERAVRDNVPAWLEATTEYNVAIYQHFGFRIEEVVKVGVGKLAADGWPLDGGPGVNLWVMVCDAHVK